jgi:hypothetical protein
MQKKLQDGSQQLSASDQRELDEWASEERALTQYREDSFGFLWRGYRAQHFTACLEVFLANICFALVSVFIADNSLLKLFLFGLINGASTLTVALQLPYEEFVTNSRKVILGISAIVHVGILISVQVNGATSGYLFGTIVLCVLVFLVLLRHRLPCTSCVKRDNVEKTSDTHDLHAEQGGETATAMLHIGAAHTSEGANAEAESAAATPSAAAAAAADHDAHSSDPLSELSPSVIHSDRGGAIDDTTPCIPAASPLATASDTQAAEVDGTDSGLRLTVAAESSSAHMITASRVTSPTHVQLNSDAGAAADFASQLSINVPDPSAVDSSSKIVRIHTDANSCDEQQHKSNVAFRAHRLPPINT